MRWLGWSRLTDLAHSQSVINVPCPGGDARAAAHHIATEGKHERLITSAVAAFHARFSGKGQVDIEGARAAMRLA